MRSLLALGVNIPSDLCSIEPIVVRKHIGIRHMQYFKPKHTCLLLLVDKCRIGKLHKPVVVVIDRVIDAVAAARAYVRSWYSQMLQERRVIRSAAQIADMDLVRLLSSFRRSTHTLSCGVAMFLVVQPLVIYGATFRTGNALSHLADELFQTRDGLRVEVRPGNTHICIEVGNGMCKLCRVLFAPLRRAHQTLFLSIPTSEDDRALGLPSLLQQLADAMHRLQHRSRSAIGIDCAIHPCIPVIAGYHPRIWLLGPSYLADHIPD